MIFIKKAIKKIVFLLFFKQKIVVASTGRSGSTLLFNAIVSGLIRKKFNVGDDGKLYFLLKKFVGDFAVRLSDINSSPVPVLKTHDLLDRKYENDAKFIFIYGEPLESALSVKIMTEKRGSRWFNDHLHHLNSSGEIKDLFQKDILNYENQIKSWAKGSPEHVLTVNYDDLWKCQKKISSFLGFDVEFPEKLPRVSKDIPKNINNELFEHLRHVMSELSNR